MALPRNYYTDNVVTRDREVAGAVVDNNGSSRPQVAVPGDLSGYQPLDSDLTAIAALSTTSYGRSLLTLANAAALNNSIWSGRSVAINTTATTGDDCIIVTAAATITLPAAATFPQGKRLSIVAAADGVVIDGNASETINGDATITLYNEEAAILVSNGSNWRIS